MQNTDFSQKLVLKRATTWRLRKFQCYNKKKKKKVTSSPHMEYETSIEASSINNIYTLENVFSSCYS